jgi:type IV pilus assembly protein PilO
MNLSEISWDLEYSGAWPVPVKAFVIGILCAVLAGLWYYLDTGSQMERLSTEAGKEIELRASFEQKQRKAASLEEYKEQLLEIEKTFGDLLRQLPNKTQVPELLVDVSQTGLASGLEFQLFKPGAEIIKDFYAELPIEVKVLGNFPEFGSFVSGLATLPRIVTVHNIKITPNGSREAGMSTGRKFALTMNALVRTYRYLDEGEMAAGAAKSVPKSKP